MAAGPPPPPITDRLIGWYTAHSLTALTWRDLSGAKNGAAVSGNVTFVRGSGTDLLNGQPHLQGDNASSIAFPAGILPVNYTLFHVARCVR